MVHAKTNVTKGNFTCSVTIPYYVLYMAFVISQEVMCIDVLNGDIWIIAMILKREFLSNLSSIIHMANQSDDGKYKTPLRISI